VAGGAALGESGGSRAGAAPQPIKRTARLMSPVVITIALTMALSTALILTLTQITEGISPFPGLRGRSWPSGSRRGPVNDHATTRNDPVAREPKCPAHEPDRGIAAGQRTRPSYLAKVGVAGSNPVVRSRSEAVFRPVEPSAGHTLGHTPPLAREAT